MNLAPGTRVERYVVEQTLGRGGMATVYAVRHALLGTHHALKVLHDPRAGERLLREGRVQARLESPNVVPVTDVVCVGGGHGLIMPLVQGCGLDGVLAEHRLSEGEVAGVFGQIVAGVRAAHAAGVVHRDLKPANVLLEPKRGRILVRVADFGLAKDHLDPGQTRSGAVMGTPAYAPPEQLDGERVGAEADLWSLGALLYELLTGSRPFRSRTLGELRAAARSGDWDRAPVSPAWRPVVEALLAPSAERRLLHLPVTPDPLVLGTPLAEVVRVRAESRVQEATLTAGAPGRADTFGDTPPSGPAPSAPVPHTLPAERDTFVGRAADLATLGRLIGDSRLVSVLGTGGSGKTRLVTRFGWASLPEYPGGVWFCDLSEARSLEGVVAAVARAIDVPLGSGDPVNRLGHAIAGRGRCLVVLDNFEQVARHARATVGPWLDAAPEARFVVTTREVLGLPGEAALPLAPLDDDASVDLFVARARQAKPSFAPDDLDVIRSLVALLDGLPLAIELAAARVRVVPPATLLRRMSQRFKVLATRGGRHTRQATLRGTLDWSWDLLSPDEQAALAQLSVFEGGFTLEAAEEVLLLDDLWGMDAIQSLVDKSLVRQAGDDRFDLLVSVQEYATEKLAEHGDAVDAMRRHALYYAGFGSSVALGALDRHGGLAARSALVAELDNVVVACRRSVRDGDGPTAVASLRAAWMALVMKGPYTVAVALAEAVAGLPDLSRHERAHTLRVRGGARRGVRRSAEAHADLEEACALYVSVGDGAGQGGALRELAALQREWGRPTDGRPMLEAALALYRAAGDATGEAVVLDHLATIDAFEGHGDDARQRLEAALAIHRATGNRRSEASVLTKLGTLHMDLGALERAGELLHRAVALTRAAGDRSLEGAAATNLANLYSTFGDAKRAERHYLDALEATRQTGDRYAEGIVVGNLANLHKGRGDRVRALALYERALQIAVEIGDTLGEAHEHANLGDLHLEAGALERAAPHLEAAVALQETLGVPRAKGLALAAMSRLHLAAGRPAAALEALDVGEPLLRGVGDRVELAVMLCTRARCAHGAGDATGAAAALAEARGLATAAGVGHDSPLGRAITAVAAELEAT